MHPIKIKDLKDGDLGEDAVLPMLELYFQTKLTKTHKKFEMDFIDETGIYYEVKSRNNNYKKYPTTMVGYNKIKFCNKLDKSSFFIFNFTDGVYYYEYDKTKESELDIKIGGRCDRGRPEYKDYAYIPIELLTKLYLKPTPPNQMGIKVLNKGKVIEELNATEILFSA